jgi:hypothetical protein
MHYLGQFKAQRLLPEAPDDVKGRDMEEVEDLRLVRALC